MKKSSKKSKACPSQDTIALKSMPNRSWSQSLTVFQASVRPAKMFCGKRKFKIVPTSIPCPKARIGRENIIKVVIKTLIGYLAPALTAPVGKFGK